MNTRNLVTSLSQQLDTSCTDFPDGFEETQQIQVSFRRFLLFLLLSFVWTFYCQTSASSFKLFVLVWVENSQEPSGVFPHLIFANRMFHEERKKKSRTRIPLQAICLNKCKKGIVYLFLLDEFVCFFLDARLDEERCQGLLTLLFSMNAS